MADGDEIAGSLALDEEQVAELKKRYSLQGEAAAESYLSSLDATLQAKLRPVFDNLRLDGFSLEKLLTLDPAGLKQKFQSGFETATATLQDFALDFDININVDGVNESFNALAEGFAKTSTLIDIGIMGFSKILESKITQNPMLVYLKSIESEALKIDKIGLEGFGNRLNLSNLDNSAAALGNLNEVFRAQVQELVNLGYSSDEAARRVRDIGKNTPLTITELKSLGAGAADAGRELIGLAGFERILAATGLEQSTANSLLTLQMRSLGVASSDAMAIFDTLSKVQKDSGLTITDISQNVVSAAGNFKLYGDNLDGLSVIYKKLLTGLGEGKQAIAGDIFSKLAGGIAGMNTEMKAFIGMTSSLGGGGGALESALRIDEAIASGEGLDEVMEAIYEKVEQISGTPILTRAEALATGQAQTYAIQGNLLEQFTGARGPQVQEQLARARQGAGQNLTVADLRPGADFGRMITGQSEMVLNQQLGPMTRLQNQVTGTLDLEATSGLSKTLLDIGNATSKAGLDMVGAFREITEKIRERGRAGIDLQQMMGDSEAKSRATVGKDVGTGLDEVGKALIPGGLTENVSVGDRMSKIGTSPLNALSGDSGFMASMNNLPNLIALSSVPATLASNQKSTMESLGKIAASIPEKVFANGAAPDAPTAISNLSPTRALGEDASNIAAVNLATNSTFTNSLLPKLEGRATITIIQKNEDGKVISTTIQEVPMRAVQAFTD